MRYTVMPKRRRSWWVLAGGFGLSVVLLTLPEVCSQDSNSVNRAKLLELRAKDPQA